MSVGRNETCPCGSGKKYKKCCGVVTSIEEARKIREQKLKTDIQAALERLNKYVMTQSPEKMQEARKQFAQEIGLDYEEVISTEWVLHFYNWYLFEAREKGMSMLQRFLQQLGRRIDPDVQSALLNVQLGVYEVEEVTSAELALRDLATGEKHMVLPIQAGSLQAGHILLSRLVSLGLRDMALSGSIILQPGLKSAMLACLSQKVSPEDRSIALYKAVIWSGKGKQPTASSPAADKLHRLVVANIDANDMRKRIQAHPAFELKKRGSASDIWIYSRRKEAHLFPALNDTLLELHEVGGELLISEDALTIEAPQSRLQEIAELIGIPATGETAEIDRLTSTGGKLHAGTLFITSEPNLPSKVLQWAVQTYFADKWLITPHVALNQLPPVVAAASTEKSAQEALQNLVETIEAEGKMGHGIARFMRIDALRPSLSMANSQIHINNLLQRPVLEGLPESEYTVAFERFAEITAFVTEVTEGKSEATVKKYDEVMNLFRSFIRGAFGPSFEWGHLRKEEVAFFLVQEIPRRTDSLTKTLATNTLSVLSAFLKWLDKRDNTNLASAILPLFSEIKDDLSEAYRLRSVLQKTAVQNLTDSGKAPREVKELHLHLLEQTKTGWIGKGDHEETLQLILPDEEKAAFATDWIIAGLMGRAEDGNWHLYGTPMLYPPVIGELLGIRTTVLV